MLCLPTRCMDTVPPPAAPAFEVADTPRENERPEWAWPSIAGAAFRVTTLIGYFSMEQEGWLSLEVDVVKWYTAAEKKVFPLTTAPKTPKKQLTLVIALASARLVGDVVHNGSSGASTPVLVLEDEIKRDKLVLRLGTAEVTHQWWSALSTAQLLSRRLLKEKKDVVNKSDDEDRRRQEQHPQLRRGSSSSDGGGDPRRLSSKTLKKPPSDESSSAFEDDSEEEETNVTEPGGGPFRKGESERVVDVSQSSALRQAYEQVLRLIIRPPRAQYSLSSLGPKRFTFLGRVVVRRDFCVTNRRGLRVHASLWQPYWGGGEAFGTEGDQPRRHSSDLSDDGRRQHKEISPLDAALFHKERQKRSSFEGAAGGASDDDKETWPGAPEGATETSKATLVYLHGNASGRVEALSALTMCCTLGLSLCAIDCAGSGMSDGDYVSLGHYESEDVACVVSYLRKRDDAYHGLAFKYGLWGRSMGAMTALLYACRHAPHASCLVLDSPFTSLERLCKDLVRKATDRVPRAAVAVALRQVRTSVKYRTGGFDLKDCDALSRVPSCVAPALFVHGLEDDFITSEHTDEIYAAYGGKHKSLMKPPGNHNATRPSAVFFGVERFLKRHLPCRPLTKTQVAAMSSSSSSFGYGEKTSKPSTKVGKWEARDNDAMDFALDDLTSPTFGDNVYLVPPWKFATGDYGHDPTITVHRYRGHRSPTRAKSAAAYSSSSKVVVSSQSTGVIPLPPPDRVEDRDDDDDDDDDDHHHRGDDQDEDQGQGDSDDDLDVHVDEDDMPDGDFISGYSDERQRQAQAKISNLFGH